MTRAPDPDPAQKSHPRLGTHALKVPFETFNVLKGTFMACPPRAEAA
jgi:hypothetical protein